jgi:alpha-galactosidase
MKTIIQSLAASLLLLIAVLAMHPLTAAAQPKKLRVFILAGQSNMEGPASIKTFDYIGDDPATAALLKRMRGADGKPCVCDRVRISYLTGSGDANGEGTR